MLRYLLIPILYLQVVLGVLSEVLPSLKPSVVPKNTSLLSGRGVFRQLIDHTHPEVGTFSQKYWFNTTYWGGPGSPIIFYTPGQHPATNRLYYLTDTTLPGLIAKEVRGAVVLVEHRYFGESQPFDNLSTSNLQYLALDQVLADFVHFARTVELPFDLSGNSHPLRTPWIWVGNSYSATLVAWTERLFPNTFWAYYASGAAVNSMQDFWQFNYPTQQGMPQSCRSNLEAIISHVDNVFLSGSPEQKQELKIRFGLQDLSLLEDTAYALSQPIIGWTLIQPSDTHTQFSEMCNAIENANFSSSRRDFGSKTNFQTVLDNYADWFKTSYLPRLCERPNYSGWTGRNSVQCLDTVNLSSQAFHDLSVQNDDRVWDWIACNYFFFWQTGSPIDTPTIFSRLIDPVYYERRCRLIFPKEGNATYGIAAGVTDKSMNALTGGWNRTGKRILFTNGEFDPWRSASVSSVFRPDGPMQSTSQQPIILIKGVQHQADMYVRNRINKEVREAMDTGIAQISRWVLDFYTENSKTLAHDLQGFCVH
ncbi:hypothetical protein COCVIDRAFT_116699 [Bipolaris victoriae FI3]|uniref:Serine protease vicPb n=1 Tax=Bipolaris victoriae (strain FI3) TaxID=930091 RepID=VICPB_BIPV3|nr:hypothetical protein COCVIDRAFT_116699 [Bipolaris victoriae FI3]W7E3A0.1 RecName: Full=Serine protease vicPb; AltName: Full=Victorin biosynthesis cluster protein Pb; Flags: Precursor [Bipolaris victoriae FI3]